MARGGRREGAGGRPAWRYGKTKPVRVPIALADKILEIAKILDEGNFEDSDNLEEFEELVTGSKAIDLTGVAILYSKDGPVVRLADLVRVGYAIRPERLLRSLKVNPSGSLDLDGILSKVKKEDD